MASYFFVEVVAMIGSHCQHFEASFLKSRYSCTLVPFTI